MIKVKYGRKHNSVKLRNATMSDACNMCCNLIQNLYAHFLCTTPMAAAQFKNIIEHNVNQGNVFRGVGSSAIKVSTVMPDELKALLRDLLKDDKDNDNTTPENSTDCCEHTHCCSDCKGCVDSNERADQPKESSTGTEKSI